MLRRAPVEKRRQTLRRSVISVDVICVLTTVLLAGEIARLLDNWLDLPFVGFGSSAVVTSMSAIWLISLLLVEAQDPSLVMAGTDYYVRALRGTFWAFATLGLIGFAFDVRASRPYIVVGLPLGLVTVTTARWCARQTVRRLAAARPDSAVAERVVSVTGIERRSGHDRVQSPHAPHITSIGTVHSTDVQDIVTFAQLRKATVVLLEDSHELSTQQVETLGWALDLSGIALYLEARAGFLRPGKTILIPHPAMTLLNVKTVHLSMTERFLKRTLDFSLSLFLLILSLPAIALASIAVVLDSGFPAFFRQVRVGIDGKPFTIRKIRTMVDSEDDAHPVRTCPADEPMKPTNDPRRTRVGRVLRRWSIDELPQLVNVLGGSMSLVGPRPRLPNEPHDTMYSSRRLRARPGLTGLWQVSGRANLTFAQADLLDVEYVDNWSLLSDITILLRTVKAVARGDGAY